MALPLSTTSAVTSAPAMPPRMNELQKKKVWTKKFFLDVDVSSMLDTDLDGSRRTLDQPHII